MELALGNGQIIMLAALLLAGGIVAGVLSGLFGVGGGGILVPVLYELFGALGSAESVRMHLAIGTSFAIIIPTAFRAARSHYQRGAIDGPSLRLLGPAAIGGVLLGSLTASVAGGAAMKLIWVMSASLLSISLLLKHDFWRLKGEIATPQLAVPIGAGIGFIATLMGVGGGAQIAAILRMFGRGIHLAVGTAAGFSCIVALPAFVGYIWAGWSEPGLPPGSVGFVSLIGAAAMIPASVLSAPVGVRLAHGLDRRKLEIAFAIFLLAVGLRFLLALLL